MSQQSNPATLREALAREIADEFCGGSEAVFEAILAKLAASGTEAAPFKCKARTANMGANDPQDCDWPVCGCDPYADKVIEALQESGITLSRQSARAAALEEAANVVDECNREGPYNAIGAASRIRALAAASPEGEWREPSDDVFETWWERHCIEFKNAPHHCWEKQIAFDAWNAALRQSAAPSGALRLSEEILVDAARLIRRRKRAGADNEEIEGCAMVCDAMRDDSFAQESKTGAVTGAGERPVTPNSASRIGSTERGPGIPESEETK